MSEIQRYFLGVTYDEDGNPALIRVPDNTGKWVLWEDVRSYVEPILILPTDNTEAVVLLTRCGCERTVSIVKGENKCMLPLRPSYHIRAYNAGDFPNYVAGPVYGSRDFMWQGRRRANGVRIFEEQ